MHLNDNSKFGVKALTEAINRIDVVPTQIRDLAVFESKPLTTTYVDIENQSGSLKLVESRQRGLSGEAIPHKSRDIRTFKIPHLPVDDILLADDVQNVRAFGGTDAEAVQNKVNEKLADGKMLLEYTREHMMLGALQGKILNANGEVVYDLYKEFGLTRQTHQFDLANTKAEVGSMIDSALATQKKLLKGAMVTGWVALCGLEFLQKLKYHPSIEALYTRWRDGAAYREGNATLNPIEFAHNGINFIHYTGDFGKNAAKIADNEAILLPVGRKLYAEYFAPADFIETVNTRALPYYAKQRKLDYDKGYGLHMQSNPLPIVLRPELVATLAMK